MKRYALGIAAACTLSAQALATDCIPSGVTDQYTYFVAVDSTDFTTRETGLSGFTVYRSRNGGAAAAFTTPTINETDATNMPGVYELLLDEDMTIDAGDDVQHMTLHVAVAGMAPVTKEICIGRSKITAGNTLAVASDGDLTEVNTLTGHTAQTGDSYARLGAPAGASVSADIAALPTAAENADANWDEDATGHQTQGTFGQVMGDSAADSDSIWSLANTNLNATVSSRASQTSVDTIDDFVDTEVAAILADTADMQPKLGTFSDLGSGATLAGNLEDMRDDGTATYSRTTDSLQAIRDRGDAAWTTGSGACPDDVICTTVATAPTTTSFTATAAPNDDTQLDGWAVLFTDNGDADSYCLRTISSVSTGTITYASACPFTVAAGDVVALLPAFLDLGVDITAISGDATAADNLEAALDGTGGVTITAGLTGNITGNLSGSAGSVTGAVGSVTGNVGGNVTGSVGSVATGGIASTSFAAGAINASAIATDAIGAAEVAADAVTEIQSGLSTLSSAQVNTEVDTALADIHLDHLFATDYDPASKPGTATALLNELVESDAGVSRFTANALEQAPTGGGETLDAIADAVWDELLSGHAVSGSTGEALTNAAAGGGLDAAGVRAAIGLATANLDTQLADIPTVSEFNARTVTSATYATATALQTVDDNVDAILVDTAEIGAAGAGLTAADDAVIAVLGTPAGASMSADIAAAKSDTAAILVDTAEIGVAGAGLTAADDAVIAAIAALNDLASTDVRDLIIEDQGGGVSLGCALAVLLAYASGDIVTSGTTTTYEEPSGTETRTTGTVTSAGNRTATITCPSY